MSDFRYDNGGRADAGYKGSAGDCVTRAVAIASGLPYAEVYAALAQGTGTQRVTRGTKARGATARNGINTKRKWFKDYMAGVGFLWTPTMHIGSGCTVHLCAEELPAGRLVVAVSKHYTAVIDGVIHDTHDPRRETHAVYTVPADAEPKRGWRFLQATPSGQSKQYASIERRCVYGYWRAA